MIDKVLHTRPWQQILALWRNEPAMIEEKDVPKLLALAHQHKVIGHVYQRYQNQQSTCPEVMKRLKNAYEPLQKKALRRCSELIRIQQELQKDEIRMMPFKGVTLSEQLFGDPGIKQSSDLDILVDKKNVLNAHKALLKLNYRMKVNFSLDEKNLSHFLKFRKDFVYFNEQGVCVELHWRLAENPFLFNLNFETLWRKSDALVLANETFRTINQSDYFIYLCLHGSLSFFHRLTWLTDIATRLETEDFNWRQLIERAKCLGAERALVVGTVMACLLNRQNYPNEILECYEKNIANHNLLKTLIWGLKQPFLKELHWIDQRMKWQLTDNRKIRIAHLRTLVWSRYRHWDRLPIPSQLYWLTYCLEPLFSLYWAIKHTRNGFAHFYQRIKSIRTH